MIMHLDRIDLTKSAPLSAWAADVSSPPRKADA